MRERKEKERRGERKSGNKGRKKRMNEPERIRNIRIRKWGGEGKRKERMGRKSGQK